MKIKNNLYNKITGYRNTYFLLCKSFNNEDGGYISYVRGGGQLVHYNDILHIVDNKVRIFAFGFEYTNGQNVRETEFSEYEYISMDNQVIISEKDAYDIRENIRNGYVYMNTKENDGKLANINGIKLI